MAKKRKTKKETAVHSPCFFLPFQAKKNNAPATATIAPSMSAVPIMPDPLSACADWAAIGAAGCPAGVAGSLLGIQTDGCSGAVGATGGADFVLSYQLRLKPMLVQNASVWQLIDEQAAHGGQTTQVEGQFSGALEVHAVADALVCCGAAGGCAVGAGALQSARGNDSM